MAGNLAESAENEQDEQDLYAASLEWAQDNLIIDPAMINFQPEDYITRENMMVLSYKYMLYTGSEFDSAGDISKFPDAGKISEYAVDAVKYLTNTGVILGDSQGIRPSDTVTRAEAAPVLMRIYDINSQQNI